MDTQGLSTGLTLRTVVDALVESVNDSMVQFAQQFNV